MEYVYIICIYIYPIYDGIGCSGDFHDVPGRLGEIAAASGLLLVGGGVQGPHGTRWATVNIMDSGAMFRVEIGFDIGARLWPLLNLLNALCMIHVPLTNQQY